MSFLQNKYARILTFILLLQGVCYYAVARRSEHIPVVSPLAAFPTTIGPWYTYREYPMEKEVEDVLKADDTMNRVYKDSGSGQEVSLFMAFFRTQRNGQSPHSPKNCLPGAGWDKVTDDRQTIAVSDWPEPIHINRFVVERGSEKSVTLYWYHSHNRVIASEFSAKWWLVADAIRYHRSDTALVRVVVPVAGEAIDRATDVGVGFIKTVFPSIVHQFPQ